MSVRFFFFFCKNNLKFQLSKQDSNSLEIQEHYLKYYRRMNGNDPQ